MAVDGAGGLLVGECKWGTIGKRDLETLQRRGRLVATELSSRAGSTERITHVLFSAGGIERTDELDARLQDGDVIHIPIEALYQENES